MSKNYGTYGTKYSPEQIRQLIRKGLQSSIETQFKEEIDAILAKMKEQLYQNIGQLIPEIVSFYDTSNKINVEIQIVEKLDEEND